MNTSYKPEGFLKYSEPVTRQYLERAKTDGTILEARAVMCDSAHNLTVDFGGVKGIIPREEAAIGIKDGTVKDIAVLTRVNKPVCFKIEDMCFDSADPKLILSRVKAQEEALSFMMDVYRPGDVIDARITHLEPFGAFADIGCGIVGLISIENISVSRISHPKDRFAIGQNIKTIIKDIDYAQKRFSLSHKELLGTWRENADRFSVGETVCGTVRSVEDYGIFVELTPNLAGLAEYRDNVVTGEQATVYIKNIIPEKMKVKLSIIDHFCEPTKQEDYDYYIGEGHIDRFRYSPPESPKLIETVFE